MKCDYCQYAAQDGKNTCERCDKVFERMITFNDEVIESLVSNEPLDVILMDETIALYQEKLAPFQDARYNDRAIVLSAYLADNDLLMDVESVYPHLFTEINAFFFTKSLGHVDALLSAHRCIAYYVGPDCYDPRFRSDYYKKEVVKYIDFCAEMM